FSRDWSSDVCSSDLQGQRHPRDRRRSADRGAEPAGHRHHRPAPERAALRLAAEHHEGQEEAAGRGHPGRSGRVHRLHREDPEGRSACRAQRRREGEVRGGTGRETEERGEGDLMAMLVIAEHNNAALAAVTMTTVAAAAKIGGDIHVLVAGQNVAGVAETAAKIAGESKVLVADDAAYANLLPENVAPLIAELGKGYSHVLAPATTNGKNYLPRVAALLDVDQISEIIAVESADTFKRPIYAGNAIATVQSSAAIKVITVRGTGFDPVAAEGGSAAIEAVSGPADAGKSAFVGEELAKSDRPELTAAKIVVSGGRGM